jgi:hypothetical protein
MTTEGSKSLYTITFDSDPDPSLDDEDVADPSNPSSPIKGMPNRLPIRRLHGLPTRQPQNHITSTEPITIVRVRQVKVNGVRLVFEGYQGSNRLFTGKAKHFDSSTIPISRGSEIHLASPQTHIAFLVMKNDLADFTLIEGGPTQTHSLVVQFSASRTMAEGQRRTRLTFLADFTLPSPLDSVPATASVWGHRLPLNSIKNTVLANEDGEPLITVRKTAKDRIDLDSRLKLDPLHLFGIGIAIFVGRRPTR